MSSVFHRFRCTGFWQHLNRGHSCRNRRNMRLLSALPLLRLPAPAFRCIWLLHSHFCHTPPGALSAAHLPLVPMAPMKHLNHVRFRQRCCMLHVSNELHGVCSVFFKFRCTGFWQHLNPGHSCRNRCNMRLLSALPLLRLPASGFRCIWLLRSHFCHTPSGVLSAAHMPLVPMKHLNRVRFCQSCCILHVSNELHGVCSVFSRFGCTGFWQHLNRGHSCRNRCNMRLFSVLPLSRLPAPAFRCIWLLRSHFCHTPSGALSTAYLPLVPMAPMKHLNRVRFR